MGNAVTVDIKGKNEQVKKALDETESFAGKFGLQIAASFAAAGAAIAAALSVQQIIAWGQALVSWTQDAVSAALEAESAMAKFEAVTRASGGASGFTADEVAKLALEMQRLTKFNEEQVLEAASVLSIYQNISGDAFPRTIRLAADMAELFGGDLSASIRSVGLALDSPTEGITRLVRQGARLDEQTIALIKSLDEQGRTVEAQEIVFAALEDRFLGVAEAMGETTEGKIVRLTNRFGEMQEQIGDKLIPILDGLFPLVETLAAGFEQMINSIEGDIDASGLESLQDNLITLIAQTKTYLDVLKQVNLENTLAFGSGVFGKLPGAAGFLMGASNTGMATGTLFDTSEIQAVNERELRLNMELQRINDKRIREEKEKQRDDSKRKAKEIREADAAEEADFQRVAAIADAERNRMDAFMDEQAEREKEDKKKTVKDKIRKERKEKEDKEETEETPEARFEALEALHQRIQSAAASARPEEKFAEIIKVPMMELADAEVEMKESIDKLDATIKDDLAEMLGLKDKDDPMVGLMKTSGDTLKEIAGLTASQTVIQKEWTVTLTDIKDEIGKVGKLY